MVMYGNDCNVCMYVWMDGCMYVFLRLSFQANELVAHWPRAAGRQLPWLKWARQPHGWCRLKRSRLRSLALGCFLKSRLLATHRNGCLASRAVFAGIAAFWLLVVEPAAAVAVVGLLAGYHGLEPMASHLAAVETDLHHVVWVWQHGS